MVLQKVKRLIDYWERWDIPMEHKHEVNPWLDLWSRENYLYFTLPVSLNFQRSSTAMRKAALDTWEDTETNYLFFPELVVEAEYEKIQADLRKHKLSLQPNKHTQIRTTISKSLFEKHDSDPRKLVSSKKRCVVQIQNYLRENKKNFPYLNWSKMCDYWMFIMHHYTDIKLQNKHKLSIIPDTHIQQASIVLWVSLTEDKPDMVKEKWFKLLKWTDINPVDLHSMLWNWSRNDFKPWA